MKYSEYLLDKNLFTQSYSDIDSRMYDCTVNNKDDEFCRLCHDEALRQLAYDSYFEERYKGESNDIAYFIAEQCYVRLCNEWKYEIIHWINFIRKNEIRYKNAFRYLDRLKEKIYAYTEDTELDYAVKLASGLVPQKSENKVNKVYCPIDLLEMTMKRCKYQEDDLRYRYLEVSIMLSIVRGNLIEYNIDKLDKNHLIFLVNTYKILERKLVVDSDNKF